MLSLQPTSANVATVAKWLSLIQAEYREMPGMHLTRQQVQRLWGLDQGTCAVLLDTLVGSGFLRVTRTGAYVLADGAR